MRAVQTDEQNRLVIDGSHPTVSPETETAESRREIRVTLTPVPPELKAFFFGDRTETVVYTGSLGEDTHREIEVEYQSAHLDPEGQLSVLVLSGALPTETTDRTPNHPSLPQQEPEQPSVALA